MQSDLVYEARAEVLKAMAHPSRLKMLDALEKGERCVCELQKLVGSDLSTVSRHLSVMKAAGIVSIRKHGSNVYYRLRVPCLLRVFGCIEAVLAADAKDRGRLAKDLA
ncbi:MAG TPA: metalloregulator ArsR/SmtB family transcription factor [Anaeromyxobacteraceae bacterium]|nr:metalloregulator ArsR/SmtB family transcription factor [Anaeromyxobacteraceae bacterium]